MYSVVLAGFSPAICVSQLVSARLLIKRYVMRLAFHDREDQKPLHQNHYYKGAKQGTNIKWADHQKGAGKQYRRQNYLSCFSPVHCAYNRLHTPSTCKSKGLSRKPSLRTNLNQPANQYRIGYFRAPIYQCCRNGQQ